MCAAFQLELERHLEQPRRARVARVEAMAEARAPARRRSPSSAATMLVGGVAIGRALRTSSRPCVEELHAALDVAAVVAAEAEHAGRDARAQRRAGRRRVARRERRRRRGAVIDERHEDRLHQAADRRRRHLAHEQQVDRLAEGEAPHDLVERVAAHQDLVRLDAGERRPPLRRAASGRRRRSSTLRCGLVIRVPYSRSPKSPRPGTMYLCSLSCRSIAGV